MRLFSQIMAAVRANFAMLAAIVLVPVFIGGKFIGSVMRMMEPPPAPGAADVEAAIAQQGPPSEDRITAVQRVLEALSVGDAPARRDMMRLFSYQRVWVSALTPGEALTALLVEVDALKAHLQGGRQIPGVLACRQDAVEARKRPAEMYMEVTDGRRSASAAKLRLGF